MNELESWIWVIMAVGVPTIFVLACINTKPHVSHVWEMKRVMEAGIVTNQKGEVISVKKPWYLFWK